MKKNVLDIGFEFLFCLNLHFMNLPFTIYILFIDDEIYCLNVELMTCEIVIRFLFPTVL